MYEIFSVSFGWDFTHHKENIRWIVSEYLAEVYGQQPYTGSGDESSAYIGEDLYTLDAHEVLTNTLTLENFNKSIKSSFEHETKVARDVPKWRNEISKALKDAMKIKRYDIKTEEYDEIMKVVEGEPQIFFTWGTS